MAKKHHEKPEVIRVRMNDQLEQDLAQARELTGIQATSELVRLAVHQLAQGKAAA
jgi:hypothetical protein